jgi:biopolymer transport protein TolQ
LEYAFTLVGSGAVAEIVRNSGPVARSVLVILLILSVVSWAIIFSKWATFRRARGQTRRFLRAFRKTRRLPEMHAVSETFRPSPLVAIFEAGYEEYARQAGPGGAHKLENIERALKAQSVEQVTVLESRLPWLATTAAASPFIGLFGTVWGIIDAFHGLGTQGVATLRVVAPGISEALITTAAGLFAAIPALIGYNFFVHQLKEFAAGADEFSLEFQNATEMQPAQARTMVETR